MPSAGAVNGFIHFFITSSSAYLQYINSCQNFTVCIIFTSDFFFFFFGLLINGIIKIVALGFINPLIIAASLEIIAAPVPLKAYRFTVCQLNVSVLIHFNYCFFLCIFVPLKYFIKIGHIYRANIT